MMEEKNINLSKCEVDVPAHTIMCSVAASQRSQPISLMYVQCMYNIHTT